jgi:NTE family protein
VKALVLGGGGAKGSFQAGVIEQLVRERFDMVVGTSAGALNAVGYAHLGTSGLLDMWRGINGRGDFFSRSWLPPFSGVFSTYPLRKIVRSVIEKRPICDVWVSRVCLETGDLLYSKPGDVDYEDAIISSCSIPGAIEPVRRDKLTFVDGGVRENCPLKRAIDFGANEITIVLCNPTAEKVWRDRGGVVPAAAYIIRAIDLACHELLIGDLDAVVKKNSDPNKRKIKVRLFAPDKEPMDTLDFSPDKIRSAIKLGNAAKPLYL